MNGASLQRSSAEIRSIRRRGHSKSSARGYQGGGDSGAQMSALLAEHPVIEHPIRIAGTTRESFTALEASADNEYRFVLPGPALTGPELDQCLEELAKAAAGSHIVALSGSLPPGVPTAVVADVAAIARDAGARVVLDSSGDALLVTADETVRVPAINAPVRSTVGAGDSMVAGLITGFLQERSFADTLALGIAAATAALLTPGSEVCQRADIDRLYAKRART